MEAIEFTHEALEAAGFKGFVTFDQLQSVQPPDKEGVYIIYREDGKVSVFLERSFGGRFKGKDPTVDRLLLEKKWVPGAFVVYIGKATSLRKRLDQFRRFGNGEAIRPSGAEGTSSKAPTLSRISWPYSPLKNDLGRLRRNPSLGSRACTGVDLLRPS